MVCKSCGAQMNIDDIFCQKCGAKNEPEVKDVSTDSMPTVADDRNVTVSGPVLNDISVYNDMLKQIWPDWTIVNKLGEGSFGKVYKAERNEMGTTFTSAIKIITIPQNESEIETIRAEAGLDEQSTSSYFRALVDDCVNEIKMMESFKGTQNIVSVEDYKVVPHKDSVGWTIFIRMELLTSFLSYTKNKIMTEKDVIKLGIDICSALECCAKLNVMHRDIKPENIFVSSFGDYKLGDFGIARKLEKSNTGMSKKGTYNYMAPEIYGGNGQYDFKSDIYSLGIVLYKLLNNNRFPLVDARSNAVTYQQMQDAFELRMSGAKLPKPMTASNALANVILVACSFDPADRFSSASALKAALQNVQSGKADKVFDGGTVALPKNAVPVSGTAASPIAPVNSKPEKEKNPKKEKEPKPKKEKKKMSKGKKAGIIAILILALLLAAGGAGAYLYFTSPEYKINKALSKEDFDSAVEMYEQEIAGDPSKMFISSLEKRLDAIKEDFVSEEISYEKASGELTAIESFDISDLEDKIAEVKDAVEKFNVSRTSFDEAEKNMADGDYAAAWDNYMKVIEDDPDYQTAVGKMTQAQDSFRQAQLDKAEEFAENDDYTQAIKTIKDALRLDILRDDAKLLEALSGYETDFNTKSKQDILDKAAEYVAKGDYEKAIYALENAPEEFREDEDIRNQCLEYKKEYADKVKKEVLDEVEKAIEEGDYPSAIATLKKAVEEHPDIKEIYDNYNKYTDEYKKKIFSEVDTLVNGRQTSDALAVLDEAIKVLPDDKEFIEKKKEIEGKQPVSLSTLTIFNNGWEWSEGTAKDPFGNTYTDACNFKIFRGYRGEKTEYKAEYFVDKKYSTITGSVVPFETIPENGTAIVKVLIQEDQDAEYALAYSSPTVTRKTEVFDFVADITGAKYITVVIEITNGEEEADSLILMDVQLWP